MSTALKSSGSSNERLMFQPDAKNIASRIHVPIMRRSAVTTFPTPYSKRAHTFGAAEGNSPAARARLGTVSLVSFDKHRSMPSGLVLEHMSELTPPSVKHGLSHPCFAESGSVHIADDDQLIFSDDPNGLFVEMVAPGAGNLRMDCLDPAFFIGSLRDPKRRFILAVVAERRYLLAARKCREVFQAKINTHRTIAGRQIVGNFALEYHIPATSRVLSKTPGTVLADHFSRLPKGKAPLEIDRAIIDEFGGAGYERDPAERAFRTKTHAKARAPLMLIPRLGKLPADLPDCVRMYSKGSAATGSQFDQLKLSRPKNIQPTFTSTLSFTLSGHAKIPHLIACNSMAQKVPISALDAIFEAKNRHHYILASVAKQAKTLLRPAHLTDQEGQNR